MQFRLSTLLLLAVVLWSSLAVFGIDGITAFLIVVVLAIGIARAWLIISVPLALVFATLMLPAVARAPASARRAQCSNNLGQIAIALQNYHKANGCFPPAYIADRSGRPMHSWRVLILPYLECDSLYKRYDFNEPWNGPHNRELLGTRPPVYVCPCDRIFAGSKTRTSYAAVVGANAAWSGMKSRTSADFRGAASSTVLVVEAADAGIEWTEPRDVSLDALKRGSTSAAATVSSMHGYRREFFDRYRDFSEVNVALADGSAGCLSPGCLAPSVLPKCLAIGGCTPAMRNEWLYYTPPSWDEQLRLNWDNCLALAVWIASVGALMYRAVRSRKPQQAAGNSPA